MGNGVANGSVVDFGKLSGLHFARLAVIEEDQGLPAHLILMTDVDVPAAQHLGELAEQEGLDRLFAHCEGYSGDRLGYLRRHDGQGAGRLREHARPHREPDQAGGEAARRDPGLPRQRGLERPLAERGPPRGAGARAGRSRARVGARAGRAPGRPRPPPREAAPDRDPAPAPPPPAAAAPRPAGLRRHPPHARAPRRRAARQGAGGARARAGGARGSHRPEPVHGGRPRQARHVPDPDAARGPLRAQLHDAPHLQPGRPLRRQDDPLRALGLPRRQAADVLREQLRRQHGELHGRLHRQGRLGAQPRLLERRRLPEDELARSSAAPSTSSPSRTTCACTRCRRTSGTPPTAT